MAQLSGVLLDFASKLRALAVDGVVEAWSEGLAASLGLNTGAKDGGVRTLRNRIAALKEARVLERENVRGGPLRLVFLPRTETRTERTEPRTVRTETGGERGGPPVFTDANDSRIEAARQQPDGERKERNARTERTEILHIHEIHAAPELEALLRSLIGGRVSPGEAVNFRREGVSAEDEELVLERFAQMADDGDPVKKPQIMRTKVLDDMKDPGIRAGLVRSRDERRARSRVAAEEKARASMALEAEQEKTRAIKEEANKALQAVKQFAAASPKVRA